MLLYTYYSLPNLLQFLLRKIKKSDIYPFFIHYLELITFFIKLDICAWHSSHLIVIYLCFAQVAVHLYCPFLDKCCLTYANRLSYRCPIQSDLPGSFWSTHRSLIIERGFREMEQSAGHSGVPCSRPKTGRCRCS